MEKRKRSKKILFLLTLVLALALGSVAALAADSPTAAEIVGNFVVDTPHASEYTTENAVTTKEFAPNEIITDNVIDPFFANGGTLFAPTNTENVKIYVVAIDFEDLVGDTYVPYGLQRNVFWNNGSLYDLSDPDIYYTTLMEGSKGLQSLAKFSWGGGEAYEFKGLLQRLQEQALGHTTFEVEFLNERLVDDPDTDKVPWLRVPGSMLSYAVQGPADCEDYRQFARVHQSALDAAYAEIPGLDIEDADYIVTIVPMQAFGHRAGLQGGGGLDTSFSYNDQALLARDTEYRHEPGVLTEGGRAIGSGVFGVKGIWGYNGGDRDNDSAFSPRGAVTTAQHEFTHGMGMFDDYSYGWMGTNLGESTSIGSGPWGVMLSMSGQAPDLPAWRKYRMGYMNDDEIQVILPGQTVTTYVRALGSEPGNDGGSYTDDPSIKTRMIVIPKEWRTRDTFGIDWANGWNANKNDYNWYDWFTNPYNGGETYATKSFATFYTIESRKLLGADGKVDANGDTFGLDGNLAASAQGVVVDYVANPTWETGHGGGGFKFMTGANGLNTDGVTTFTDPTIGLTVKVVESGTYYDKVEITYTGVATKPDIKRVYQAELTMSDNYVTAGEDFSVDFDIMTLGSIPINDVATQANLNNAVVQRPGTPLGVPGGVAGFEMKVSFDADNLEYVSCGDAPFDYAVNDSDAANGNLTITATGDEMIDKATILSLNFKAKNGAAVAAYPISSEIIDVTLLNWAGDPVTKGNGFEAVGQVGDGTLSALYKNGINSYTEGIKGTGGSVTVTTQPTYTVSGTIVCDTPGPAEGSFIGVESVVKLHSGNGDVVSSTKSDWYGNYTFIGVPASTDYYVTAEKSKYADGKTRMFAVSAADVTVDQLKLNRETYAITGTIYGSDYSDGSNPTPLAGVNVYALSIGNAYRILGQSVTDSNGNYTIYATTDSDVKPFGAIAVEATDAAEEYGYQLYQKSEDKYFNLGMMYGIDPSDRVYPANTATYGVGGSYNFYITGADSAARTGRNVVLTKTQDVHLRLATKNAGFVYQLMNADGTPAAAPVNSLGTANGDDRIQNVAPGEYYIQISRDGYLTVNTMPFSVGATRVILRNGPTTNSYTVPTAGDTVSGIVYDKDTNQPLEGVSVESLGFGTAAARTIAPADSTANGEFSIQTSTGRKEIVFTKEGYHAQSYMVATGSETGLKIYLEPVRVLSATPEASVVKLNGNKNELTITITEKLSDKSTNVITATFSINNNAADTYSVGPYKVYVDTKGNTQIRACYIVE